MGRWKKVALAMAAVLLVAVVVVAVAGWYLSNLLRDGGLVPEHDDPEYDLVVVAVNEGTVTLRTTSDSDEDGDWWRTGLWGLEWDSDYVQVGAVLEHTDDRVIREFFVPARPPDSGPPPEITPPVGEKVRLDSFAFSGDPWVALGLVFEEVFYSSPLGEFPAWLTRGTSDTWAIFVHGKGSDQREALRMLPTVAAAGLPALVITYRNDEDLPEDPDGYYAYGLTEWADLEAAAEYAIENGAKKLVLVGYSMGGGIVTNFLYQSSLADRVVGAILDAPMLDFSRTVDLGAREDGYPQIFASLAKVFAGFRFDLDWDKLDYLARVEELDTPILLFHGDEDDIVPVETSDALAEARPDIVTYVRVAGARHVRAWNTEGDAYEAAVAEFLQGLAR